LIETKKYWFPNPENSDRQGLLVIGGDLHPERILQAYTEGIFPWFEPGCPVLWWAPNPRLILYPQDFKISKSLKKSLKKPFCCSLDTAFPEVIKACANYSNREHNTWITQEMIQAYTLLHEMGYAHSVEVWLDKQLVGGLYGISLGRVFFGESMFYQVTDASKIALYFLCQTIHKWNFDFVDCQMPTNHLLSLGSKIISRKEYMHRLSLALEHPNKIGLWT